MKNRLFVKLAIERYRLEALVEELGILHPLVLTQSKYLDNLIVKIQEIQR